MEDLRKRAAFSTVILCSDFPSTGKLFMETVIDDSQAQFQTTLGACAIRSTRTSSGRQLIRPSASVALSPVTLAGTAPARRLRGWTVGPGEAMPQGSFQRSMAAVADDLGRWLAE